MDHAKTLADALREVDNVIVRHMEYNQSTVGAREIIKKALAAYDAHPAEATTRENGEVVLLLQEIVDGVQQLFLWPRHKEALREAIAALSTHQQQGVYAPDCVSPECPHYQNSRAPQPDTVTEAYNGHDAQHHVALVLHGKFGAQCGMGEAEMWVPIARAAIEALAARGKAG